MESKIRRSRGVDRVMTVIFYLVAIFFFALLIGFAARSSSAVSWGQSRRCSVSREKEASETSCSTRSISYLSPCWYPSPRCLRRNLSGHVRETGKNDKVSENVYRDTFFPSVHRCGPVRIPGIPCILRNGKEPDGGGSLRIDPDTSAYHDDHRGCHQGDFRRDIFRRV